jgi:hypothetical protein
MADNSEPLCLRKGVLAGTKEAEFYITQTPKVHSLHPSNSHQCDIVCTPICRFEPGSSFAPDSNVVAGGCRTTKTKPSTMSYGPNRQHATRRKPQMNRGTRPCEYLVEPPGRVYRSTT